MKRIIIFFPLFLLLSGCASFSTFQTAKTIPKRTYQLGVGLSAGKINQKGDKTSDSIKYLTCLLPGIYCRYGLFDFMDMGMGTVPFTCWEADLKCQFLKENGLLIPDLAIGGGGRVEYIVTGEGHGDATKGGHTFMSFYLSRHILKEVCIYSSFRKMWSSLSIENDSEPLIEEHIKIPMNGILLGLCFEIGKGKKIMTEYDYFWSPSHRGNEIRNIGLALILGPKKIPTR